MLTNFFPCRVKFSACRKLLFSLNGGALKLQSLIWSLVWYNPFLPLHTVACVDLVSEPINIQSAQNETVEDKATLQSAGGGGSHAFKSVSWKTRPAWNKLAQQLMGYAKSFSTNLLHARSLLTLGSIGKMPSTICILKWWTMQNSSIWFCITYYY